MNQEESRKVLDSAFRLQPPDFVGTGLLRYLEDRLQITGLDFAQGPTYIPEGWETHIYRFQLEPAAGLASPFTQPLVLRIYSSQEGLPRLRQEFAAQQQLSAAAYPVAGPVWMEEDVQFLGGPFLIMNLVPGRTLFDLMLYRIWRILDGPGWMAAMHARLHQLPAADFPASPRPFLQRCLEEMEALISQYGLAGLKPGLDWLQKHRPEPPRSPCILHLDFHPLNIMVQGDRCTGILDWGESDVGDYHADLGTTYVLLKSAPFETANPSHQLAIWIGRALLWQGYLHAYRRQLPVDKGKLAYYIAWASLRRLCSYGRWLTAGPTSTGSKPTSLRYLGPKRLQSLRRCFQQWTGITVQMSDK